MTTVDWAQTILFVLGVYWVYTTADEYLGPIARATRDRIVDWIKPRREKD